MENRVVRLVGWIMAVVGLVGYLFWATSGGLVREGNWIGVDFHVYYQAARVLSRGGNIYNADISPPYVYPPLLAGLVIPLSALPIATATILWKLLQHICLLAAGILLVRLLPKYVRPLAAGLFMLGLLTTPVQDEIQVGESNSIVLLLTVGAIWLIAHTKSDEQGPTPHNPWTHRAQTWNALAGILLALAVSIKVLPALLVAYMWWRGPRSVAAVATGGFVLLQIILLALTPNTAYYWLVQFPGLFGQAFPYTDNQSMNAFFSRALFPTDPSLPSMQIASSEAVRPMLTWAANVITVATTAWVLWKGEAKWRGEEMDRTVRLLLEVGLVLLTTFLVSGSTWLHHLVGLSVPVTALLGAWWIGHEPGEQDGEQGQRLRRRTILLAIVIGATFAVLLHHPGEWVSAISGVAPGSALLALVVSGGAMWAVIALWIASAAALLRTVELPTA